MTISDFDRRVYHAIARYAFHEAVCWPSQQRVADDLGCSRYAVHRAVKRLRRAGWLQVVERRPGRKGWPHLVYALLAPFAVARDAAKRIVERVRGRLRRGVHTNQGVGGAHRPPSSPLQGSSEALKWSGGRCGVPEARGPT